MVKTSIKVEEVPILPNFHQGGFAGLYIPNRETVYITGSAQHYDLAKAVELDPHYLYFFGDIDGGLVPGIDYYTGQYGRPSEEEQHELDQLLSSYIGVDSSYLDSERKLSNIYDPIEYDLDKHVFRSGEPRQSVINFIRRLYGRALEQAYGIQDPFQFVDLYITGSLTTFQYSETSDCDVSVFPNYRRFAQSFGEDSNTTRKRLVTLSIEHIDGTFLPGTTHPLQFFVVADGLEYTDLYQPGLRSAGSIADEMWIVPPEKDRSHEVAAEFPDAYSRASSMANKMRDALDHDPEQARELGKLIHKKRQLDQLAGLGDYSEGNIVYKGLLHEGLFDRIRNELGEHIAKTAATTMYHATLPERVPLIMQEGLKEEFSGKDYIPDNGHSDAGVYFFESAENARRIGIEKFGVEPIILSVNLDDVPIKLDPIFNPLTPENDPFYGLPNVTPEHEVRRDGQEKFINKGRDESGSVRAGRALSDIPPNRIRIAKIAKTAITRYVSDYGLFIINNGEVLSHPAAEVHADILHELGMTEDLFFDNEDRGQADHEVFDGSGYGDKGKVFGYSGDTPKNRALLNEFFRSEGINVMARTAAQNIDFSGAGEEGIGTDNSEGEYSGIYKPEEDQLFIGQEQNHPYLVENYDIDLTTPSIFGVVIYDTRDSFGKIILHYSDAFVGRQSQEGAEEKAIELIIQKLEIGFDEVYVEQAGKPTRRISGSETYPTIDELSPYRFDAECYEVAYALAQKGPHLKQDAGFYLHPSRGAGDHAGNIAPDGTIIDMTAKQHDYKHFEDEDEQEGDEISAPDHPEIIPPDHPFYNRYISWERHPEQAQIIAHEEGYHINEPNPDICPKCKINKLTSNYILKPLDFELPEKDPYRAENGYPVVLDSNIAYIGPLGAHHVDVINHLNIDPTNLIQLNIWPPSNSEALFREWRKQHDDYEVSGYWGEEDPQLNRQLENWARQQDNAGNKNSAFSRDTEIRGGYNRETEEVLSVKAGPPNQTHLDMLHSGDFSDTSNLFFGYADGNPYLQLVENIRLLSFDVPTEHELDPSEYKLIELNINEQAPEYMPNVE